MIAFHHRQATTSEELWSAAGLANLPRVDDGILKRTRTAIILAAHPDDEALGCAGFIAAARTSCISVRLILFTAGEQSHPDSPTHSSEDLSRVRLREFHHAMNELNSHVEIEILDLGDGALSEHGEFITSHVTEALESVEGPALLAAPFHADGHSDHDTVGTAALRAGATANTTVLEYPIWYWHWSNPADQAWKHWHRFDDPPALDRRGLLQLYPSQTEPLSEEAGDEPILSEEFLTHFQRGFDTFAVTVNTHSADDAPSVFDELHRVHDDPWSLKTSDYEKLKRARFLRGLDQDYSHTLEIGCSVGTLSAELAKRSRRVTAIDASSTAIAAAQGQYSSVGNIDFETVVVPEQWPKGSFDLVVLSETGYYLSAKQLDATLGLIERTTTEVFTLALCHMVGDIDHWPLDAQTVHKACRDFWPTATVDETHTDDYIIDVLHISRDRFGQ